MMRRTNRLLGVLVLAAMVAAAYSQTLADRLRAAGSMSFKINNANYRIQVGVDICNQLFASGTTGSQNTLAISFLPNSLDFEVTLNQIVNSIASDQVVRLVATVSNNGNRITWTAQNIPNPVCTLIYVEGNPYPFKIYNVFGTITVDLEEVACQNDPLGVLGRKVDLRLNLDPSSEIGFTGRVADGECSAEYFLACARAFNLQFEGYGGRCPAGDVDNNGCVDDADLLIVLFNFGNAGGQGDVNTDGVVDDADLLIVLFNFGAGC